MEISKLEGRSTKQEVGSRIQSFEPRASTFELLKLEEKRLPGDNLKKLENQGKELGRMINGLISSIKSQK